LAGHDPGDGPLMGTATPDAPAGGRGGLRPTRPVVAAAGGLAAAIATSFVLLTQFNALPAPAQAAVIAVTAGAFLAVPVLLLAGVARLFRGADDDPPPAGPDLEWSRGWRVAGWLIRVAFMLAVLFLTFVAVPTEVNAAAYLAGAGHSAVFTPVRQSPLNCGRSGCTSFTSGYLAGGTPASWPTTVPVGESFAVRTLIWNAPNGQLISGVGHAVFTIFLWFVITVFDIIFIPLGVSALRPRKGRQSRR
jgi:hypothetical protein